MKYLEKDAARQFNLFYELLNDEGQKRFGEVCRAKYWEIMDSDEPRRTYMLTTTDVTALWKDFSAKNPKLVRRSFGSSLTR